MSYDYKERKVVAVLASDLEIGQAFNVLGHLALSIGARADESLMGMETLLDASGVAHLGIARYPVIVTKTNRSKLNRLVREAKLSGEVLIADYPEQMLVTGHDDQLAEALASAEESDLSYLGAVLYGRSEIVARFTGKFSLWR